MLVVWKGKTVSQIFIHQMSEIEKKENENSQRAVHKSFKMAHLGQTKVSGRIANW